MFGLKHDNAVVFLGHRTVYFLGGLFAAKESLELVLQKLNMPERKAPLLSVTDKISKGLAVLRQMVDQISTMDVEFAVTRPSWSS